MNDQTDYEYELAELARYDAFLQEFVGPPTLAEWEEAVAAEIEHIDITMLANAY